MLFQAWILKKLIGRFGDGTRVQKASNILAHLLFGLMVFVVAFAVGAVATFWTRPMSVKKLEKEILQERQQFNAEKRQLENDLLDLKLELENQKGVLVIFKQNYENAKKETDEARKETDDALKELQRLESKTNTNVSMSEAEKNRERFRDSIKRKK